MLYHVDRQAKTWQNTQDNIMKKLFWASSIALALSGTAHAGWGDLLNAAAQVATSTMAQKQQPSTQQNAAPVTSTTADIAPISTSELEYMSCATLKVNSRQANRDLEQNRRQLQQLDALVKDPAYQQQKSSEATTNMIGGLMSQFGKGSAAEYGRAMTQNSTSASVNADIELQLALNKKLTADVENIDIYLSEKKCGR